MTADRDRKLQELFDLALATEDLADRLSRLLECEDLDPRDSETQLELGKCYLKLRDFKGAESALQAAIHLADDGWARLYLGNLFYQTDQLDRAEVEFRLAHEKLPHTATPLWCLGDIKQSRGDSASAEDLYRLAVQAEPEEAEAYARLGRLFLRSGRQDDGVAYVFKALALDPTCNVALRMKDEYSL